MSEPSDDPSQLQEYLFKQRVVGEDDYDEDELRAARLRLGLVQKQVAKKRGKKRKLRRFFNNDFAAKAKYAAAEDDVLDAKEAEHKTGKCKWCHKKVWLDLFGEQWKAEGGSPVCNAAPFLTHEVPDA